MIAGEAKKGVKTEKGLGKELSAPVLGPTRPAKRGLIERENTKGASRKSPADLAKGEKRKQEEDKGKEKIINSGETEVMCNTRGRALPWQEEECGWQRSNYG